MFSPEQLGVDQMTLLPSTGQFINVSSVDTRLSVIVPHNVMLPLEFTGFTDKAGREIFEGDILSREYDFGDGEPTLFYGTVVFEDGSFCLQDDEGQTLSLHRFDLPFTVVGNVYENPNLLPA